MTSSSWCSMTLLGPMLQQTLNMQTPRRLRKHEAMVSTHSSGTFS